MKTFQTSPKFRLLTYTALGDSWGAGFEYAPFEHIRAHNTLKQYVKNTKHNLLPGRYTDDAQMALANGEVIISGQEITRETLGQSYFDCFKRDPREGYAAGFYGLLMEVKSAKELLERLGNAQSDKSGGAMRAVVWGIYPTIDEVKRLTTLQASITHNTADGINAAVAAALMGHYFLYDLGPKKDLGKFLEKHVKGPHCDWNTPWTDKVGSKGWESVHAAVTAVIKYDSLAEMLKACVNYTGDVDTVAAIAIGAASCSQEVKDDLPQVLFTDHENGEFGLDYFRDRDEKLYTKMMELRKAAGLNA